MRVLQGSTRIAFLAFFISHIPITILIDGQGALSQFYPQLLLDLVAWYSNLFGDVLMEGSARSDNVWFSSVVYCELLFQLPFFFVASKMLLSYSSTIHDTPSSAMSNNKDCNRDARAIVQEYPSWFRSACMIYGAHVSTTLVPILATFVTSHEMTTLQKCSTIARMFDCDDFSTFCTNSMMAVMLCTNSPSFSPLQYTRRT